MSILAYRFGLLAPFVNEVLVRDQIHGAHTYRNVLTEIERERRERQRGLEQELHDLELAVSAASVVEQAAHDAIKAARSKSRSKSESEALRVEHRRTKAAKREALRLWRECRTKLREELRIQLAADAVNEIASQKQRDERAKCGVYWGTYLLVEDAIEAASKAPFYDKTGVEPNDPSFANWRGQGAVGVRLQGGLPVSKAFGNDTRLRIEPLHPAAFLDRRSNRAFGKTVLRMRVGSEGRAPIWAAWPMRMHRELPRDGVIKKATVSLRKIGPREQWSVEITVDTSQCARPASSPESVIAIDVGWRVIGDELRVAAWRTENGESGDLRLSANMLSGLRKSYELRSVRDKAFDESRARLCEWLREHGMPQWMLARTVRRGSVQPSQAQAVAHLAAWKSQARLASLVKLWGQNRVEGDEQIFGALEAWRYHDFHLWCWESSQRKGSLRRRRDMYRCFAKRMAGLHSTLVIEDYNLTEHARRPGIEFKKTVNETARGNRQLASVSELRESLVNAFMRAGTIVKAPAAYTTKRDAITLEVCDLDAAPKVVLPYPSGDRDQDDNAAANLLTIWREHPSDCEILGSGEVKEKRWERAARLRAEKEKRNRIDKTSDKAAE